MAAGTPVQLPIADVFDEAHAANRGNHSLSEWARWLMEGRRSVRRYERRAIPREVLQDVLSCATWAPSAHNRQPWRFCIVTGEESKRHLAREMGARWETDLRADGIAADVVESRVAISRRRMIGAAALVIASYCTDDLDEYPDERRKAAERTIAVQSVALACQNLLLAAHAHGLGACWMCAPLFAPDIVRSALDLPDNWQAQALITLGYPSEVRESSREPLEQRVIWRE